MTDQDKREQHALYFSDSILSEAVFECLLEEWEKIETDKGNSFKEKTGYVKVREDTDTPNSENEENKMRILQEWKNRENDRIAEEQQTKTGLVITKIYQQKIAENPLKHAEGYVYQNPEEQNDKDKPKKKGEIRREEKRRLKRAREEEKMIKKQFEIIDTMMENYSREVKVQWKKELKREQMTKIDWRERRKLEKGLKTKENEKVKVETKKTPQNTNNSKERPNAVLRKSFRKKESEKEEQKKPDFYKEDKKQQNGEIELFLKNIDIEKEEEKEKVQIKILINDIDIEKKEEKTEEKKETQTKINVNAEVDEPKEEEKKTVKARIRSFFMSLCCIKGQ
ncbi:Hypothetical predicted protein [Mytilus galloprovincialis]|uniref:Uncharacterized protein n=1 Tax=Mytilus galloprovincialis TaxID=29158 RepID=A0A8B6FUJ1_MYTGA|nr:Hypothetical predicted protein [Mytilus galloprovincialis]